MAGLFDTTNDAVAQVMAQRQKANQALGSPYGKYGGIVQAGGMFADTMADAIAGGGYGSSDPAAQKATELKKIIAVVAQQFPGKTDSPDFYKAVALAVQDKYPEKAQEAMDQARKIEQEQATLESTRALTKQREETKDRSTVSERNRQVIVDIETKLQAGEELTPKEVAQARYLIAQESKPKSWTDKVTGELVTLEAFDVNAAAPNLAKFLGKTASGEGAAAGLSVKETPASKKIEEQNIKSLERGIADIEGDLRNVNKAEQLAGFFSTGRIGAAIGAIDPGSEAAALEDTLGSIKAATAFNSLRALREASKSGSSGLGQVTEVEFKALQDRMTSLRKASPTYKEDLAYIKAKWTELKQRAMNDVAALKGEKIPYPNVKSVGEEYTPSSKQETATGLKPLEVGKSMEIGGVKFTRVE